MTSATGSAPLAPTEVRALIRDIARGTHGARALAPEVATRMWSALLDEQLPEAVVGAILVAYRFKGETVGELQALRHACADRARPLALPDVPLAILPCYNGGRRLPNLAWLSALALREAGFAVLLHGVRHDAGRITTAEVAQAAGVGLAGDMDQAAHGLRTERLAFVPIDVWCPALARLLARRDVLGVRNSGHTVCKLMNPVPLAPVGNPASQNALHCAAPTIMLVPVTHAEYVPRATELLSAARCRALVFRGVDGEPALHPHAQRTVWRVDPSGVDALDLLPEIAPDPAMVLAGGATAAEVARWSAAVVAGRSPMPAMTRRLVGLALDLAGSA